MISTVSDPGQEAKQAKSSPIELNLHPRLLLQSAPHVHSPLTVRKAMLEVIIALIPATIAGIWLFGLPAAIVIGVCTVACLATEAISLYFRDKPVDLSDGSAFVTGLLLALTLPPSSPVWMCVIGSVVAISLGKHVFGGLGANMFNPALVGRVFLAISFPDLMTKWTAPIERGVAMAADALTEATTAATAAADAVAEAVTSATTAATAAATAVVDAATSATTGASAMVDAATAATPLAQGLTDGYMPLLLGNHMGTIGETAAIALIIGGIYLIARRIIDWKLPASILVSVVVMALLFGQDPIFHLLTGGLLLGAFFMATDWVTSPVTPKGRVVFGISIGVLIMVIRLWGSYPEGVTFAILLMNTATPLINEITRPHSQLVSIRPSNDKEGSKRLIRIIATMAVVSCLAGGLLAFFYNLMQPRIIAQQEKEMADSYLVIFPEADRFSMLDLGENLPAKVERVIQAYDADDNPIGIVYVSVADGFGGDISLVTGVDLRSSTITAVQVLKHTETAGLGSKIQDAAFIDQFKGKALADPFIANSDIDAISGATISSTAVINGVRNQVQAVVAAVESMQ
jgi:electron transport complex protein RnfD